MWLRRGERGWVILHAVFGEVALHKVRPAECDLGLGLALRQVAAAAGYVSEGLPVRDGLTVCGASMPAVRGEEEAVFYQEIRACPDGAILYATAASFDPEWDPTTLSRSWSCPGDSGDAPRIE